MTGREAMGTTANERMDRRKERLRVGSTVTSEEETLLTVVGFGGSFRLKRLKRRRLTVPLERREAVVKVERGETANELFIKGLVWWF